MTRGRGGGFTLVLGGGGVPGLSYLAGALIALRDRGVDPAAADLVIGTSAGALIGALLRTGCPIDDLAARSLGSAPRPGDDEHLVRRAWRSPADLLTRVVGASWVVGRSATRMPWPAPPAVLGRMFPGGLAEPCDDTTYGDLSDAWPDRAYWAVAVDIVSGRRIAVGRRRAHHDLAFHLAVRASGAVPGVFAPVRFRSRLLVDGGVHSVTNLDLAAAARPRTVVCIAPLAYDPATPPKGSRRALRLRNNAMLLGEHAAVRMSGGRALLLRPGAEQLADYGLDFLNRGGAGPIRDAARAHTLAQLDSPGARAVLDQLRA